MNTNAMGLAGHNKPAANYYRRSYLVHDDTRRDEPFGRVGATYVAATGQFFYLHSAIEQSICPLPEAGVLDFLFNSNMLSTTQAYNGGI